MDVREFLRLKEELKALQRDRDRAQGRLDSLLERLKKDHGAADEAKGRKRLARLEREAQELQREYEKKLREWEEAYGDRAGR